jgi:hypothetical protein
VKLSLFLASVSVWWLVSTDTTSLHLAAAHLVFFVASQILTPDGGRIKRVWRSIRRRTRQKAGATVAYQNSANTALLIAQK